MIDHVSIKVTDFPRARAFFAAALRPLGYAIVAEYPDIVGLGAGRKPDFWVSRGERVAPVHVAFSGDRVAVDAFHAAALAAGARDEGAPGLRAHYHPNYYGAFIIDPEGNNIEAVCHSLDGKLAAPAKSKPVRRKAAARAQPKAKGRAKSAPRKPAKRKAGGRRPKRR